MTWFFKCITYYMIIRSLILQANQIITGRPAIAGQKVLRRWESMWWVHVTVGECSSTPTAFFRFMYFPNHLRRRFFRGKFSVDLDRRLLRKLGKVQVPKSMTIDSMSHWGRAHGHFWSRQSGVDDDWWVTCGILVKPMRECVGNGRDLALFGGGPCLSDTTLLLLMLSAKSKKFRVNQ